MDNDDYVKFYILVNIIKKNGEGVLALTNHGFLDNQHPFRDTFRNLLKLMTKSIQ